MDKCLESYLIIEDKHDKKVITDLKYAYKIYPFSYLLSNDRRQMEFANEYNIFSQQMQINSGNMITLDAVLLG